MKPSKEFNRVMKSFYAKQFTRKYDSFYATEEGVYSYNTCLLTRDTSLGIIINITKYSRITTKYQNWIFSCYNKPKNIITNAPKGIQAYQLREMAIAQDATKA